MSASQLTRKFSFAITLCLTQSKIILDDTFRSQINIHKHKVPELLFVAVNGIQIISRFGTKFRDAKQLFRVDLTDNSTRVHAADLIDAQ